MLIKLLDSLADRLALDDLPRNQYPMRHSSLVGLTLLFARAFLEEYHTPETLHCLHERLIMPRGWELVLWKTRTNHLPKTTLGQRITVLRELVAQYTD